MHIDTSEIEISEVNNEEHSDDEIPIKNIIALRDAGLKYGKYNVTD